LRSISSSIQNRAADHPSRIAIVANEREISYEELYQSIVLVSCALKRIDSTGLGVVAVVAYKELTTVQLILGALQAGVVVVPINPLLKPSQLLHILNDSNASILVCKRGTVGALKETGQLPQLVKHIVVTDNLTKKTVPTNQGCDDYQAQSRLTEQQRVTECDWNDFINPAVLLYTSGSTGRPKGVIFTHNNLFFGAACISAYLNNTEADRILALMPFSFDYGLSQLTSAMYTVPMCGISLPYSTGLWSIILGTLPVQEVGFSLIRSQSWDSFCQPHRYIQCTASQRRLGLPIWHPNN